MNQRLTAFLLLATCLTGAYGAERSMTEAFSLVKEKFKNREATICPLEADAPAATEEWQFFVDPYPTQAWPSDTYIIKVKVGDIVSDVRKLKI